MASLINLKRRIRVAGNIAKTTRAMQMVAASKMRKAQEGAVKGRPYADRLTHVIQNLAGRIPDNYEHPFLTREEGKTKTLLIAFSPDKGLCGSLISNLIRELIKFMVLTDQFYITVGKKLSRVIAGNIIADFPMGVAQPTFPQITPLVSIITSGLLKKDFTEVHILYSKFISLFIQKPIIEILLPIEIERKEQLTSTSYLFEPNARAVLESLLPHYLESKLYQILLEAYACEQAARMLAMQNATENAKEIISFLTLEYNKVRQEKITNEILDNTRVTMALQTL